MTMTTNKRPSILHTGPLHSRRSVIASLSMLPLVSLARCKSDDDADRVVAHDEATRTAAALEERYGAKIAQFVDAFNDHDLDRALSFFAADATLIVNEEPVQGHDAIRDFLIEYGASGEGAALDGAHMLHEVSYFTGDAILFDGMFHGTHQRELSGYPATGFEFPIAFAFLCHFDDADRCISCDAILNWGALLPIPV
jgi:hypothetical protein